jgi:alginate O-acetyltransferase complex protein AlgI
MLFNSYAFIFIFLPLTLLGFHVIGKRGHQRIAIAWLVGASLFFYGWWNPAYLGLMLFSILFNYIIGILLSRISNSKFSKKNILIIGIVVNLAVLGYFKYANFFVDNLNVLSGANFTLNQIILPLGISFFTFQQIAYLVDSYRGETREYNFLHYCLFVTFFPQLIAGPIVHHKEMMPQFNKSSIYSLSSKNLAIGLTIFIIGLFKKVVLADGISEYSFPVFDLAEAGIAVTFFEAWAGSLSWTLQYYFDFSGYSDMAIGLARMFGIRIALNFNSPYKSTSIIDYWRRWNITLSRFLRDYVYFPLGGNRKGAFKQKINLMLTMLIGGLWHGASWTFVLWGGLNGILLIINSQYRRYRKYKSGKGFFQRTLISWSLTFISAIVVRVLFCSTSIEGAINILTSMAGLNGISFPKVLEKYFNHGYG